VGRGAVNRWTIGLLLASSTAGAAVALAQEPPEWNAKCGELDCRVERVISPWELRDVKRNRRAVKIVYESGGCLRRDGRATVTETSSSIKIAVDQGQVVAMDTPDGEFACTDELRFLSLVVRLSAPVGGRRVVGGPRSEFVDGPHRFTTAPGGRLIPLAPRVLGLAAQDARALLERQGIEATGARRGRVVSQSPAPGSRVGRGGVHLGVSR
jgi:PASTA domain